MTNKEAIKRLEWVKKRISDITYSPESFEAINLAIEALEERPTGKWGKWVILEIQCPNCLAYFQTDWYSMEELNKCPNCGVKMKGAEE